MLGLELYSIRHIML